MNFFFDRNISVHIARMMSHFDRENTITHQDDDGRFSHADEDVFIIRTVGAAHPKPIWVTADISQKREPFERAALRESGMSVVFFKRLHQDAHYQAMKVLSVWPALCEACARARVPTAFEIPSGHIKTNKVDRLGPTSELLKS